MELRTRAVRCCSFLVLALLLARPLAAQFTGTWSGTYQNQWNCAGVGGSNFTSRGPMVLVLTQSGDQVTGTATIEFSVDNCKVVPAYTLSGLVEGTVSGKTFNGIMLGRGPERAAVLTLSADDAILGVQFISQSDPPVYFLTASLTRGAAQPGPTQFTGTWSGTYQDQWNCAGGSFTSTGPMMLVLTQSGNQVTGTATIDYYADDCKVLASPRRVTGPVDGTVSGNTFNGSILGHGAVSAAILTLSADESTLAVQYKISQSPPTVYFLTANLIRGPLTTTAALTGSWSGTANVTSRCPNGGVWSGSAPFALALMEHNGSVSGVATIENEFLDDHCGLQNRQTFRLPLTGTVLGNTLTATVLDPFTEVAEMDPKIVIIATVTGPTMSLAFTTGNEFSAVTGSVTLTQTSTATPDSRFAGAWDGNYLISQGPEQGCPGLPAFSGPISATFFHAGADISGLMTFFDTKHFDGALSCRLHEHYDFTVFLSGSVSGNNAIGPGVVVWAREGVGEDSHSIPLTFTLSGDTITASGGDQGFATFTLSRSSTALPPIILRFEAAQSSITAGQSSTLHWDTFNATSVTIDNGLGAQDASGSVTITPKVTTTYTLTATINGATVTAKTTVTVLAVGRRRTAPH